MYICTWLRSELITKNIYKIVDKYLYYLLDLFSSKCKTLFTGYGMFELKFAKYPLVF